PLREDMYVHAGEVARSIEDADLQTWSTGAPVQIESWERVAALVVPSIAVLVLLATVPSLITRALGLSAADAAQHIGVFTNMPLWPLAASIVVVLILTRHLHERVATMIAGVEKAEPALALLARLLERVEHETFHSPRLSAIGAELRGEHAPAKEI